MRCKPGMLAYVKETDFPQILGRVVTVVKLRPDIGFDEWEIVFEGTDPFPEFDTKTSADRYLTPISGVPVADETPIEIDLSEAVRLTLGPDVRLPVRWPA